MAEYGSCCNERGVLVDRSHCNSEHPLKKLIHRLHSPPYLFLSRKYDDGVRDIGKHDFRSVLLHPMLSNANHDNKLRGTMCARVVFLAHISAFTLA